ncbi:hypothetical protein PR048_005682 [Dryococelus australis]|uniref:PiggyBac transposable element-derived protein 4 n=1 Tax=Dryococelus australis TaxID=614101 RepID=A0ABQ9I8V6_9NEOP|nr:hypothetical protein PR048_005682 [Dryococelus australis]
MIHYFEMLTSESSSSEDEMDCDNIRQVAANQSPAADNETENSSSESGEDNTAVDTSCGDVVDWKWEQSLVEHTYVLYKKLHGKDRTFHVFKEKLVEELLESYFKEDVVKRRSTTPGDLPSRLSGRHFPEKLAPSAAKRAKFAKRCVVCLEKKQRRESTWKCDSCNVALCIEHFKSYHTLKNY